MVTRQTDGGNDYIYYPLEYPTKVYSNIVSYNTYINQDWVIWIKSIDKSKFQNGIGDEYVHGIGSGNVLNLISVGI